jgi:hypothetical protein
MSAGASRVALPGGVPSRCVHRSAILRRRTADTVVRTVDVLVEREGGATPPISAHCRPGAWRRPVGPAGSLPPRWSCRWRVSVRTKWYRRAAPSVDSRCPTRGRLTNSRGCVPWSRIWIRARTQAISSTIVGLTSAPSRLFATLRPRVRGAYGLDGASSQPELAFTRWPGGHSADARMYMNGHPSQALTETDVAQRLGLSVATLRAWRLKRTGHGSSALAAPCDSSQLTWNGSASPTSSRASPGTAATRSVAGDGVTDESLETRPAVLD